MAAKETVIGKFVNQILFKVDKSSVDDAKSAISEVKGFAAKALGAIGICFSFTKFNSTVQSDANGFFIHDSSCVCGYGYLHRIPGKADLEFFSDSSICCCFFADCESTFSILSAMEMENRSISRYTGYEGYGCK